LTVLGCDRAGRRRGSSSACGGADTYPRRVGVTPPTMGLIKKAKKEKKETIEAAYEVEKSLLGSGQFATVHRGQPKAAGRTCLAPDGSERQVPSQVAVKNIDKSKAGASADCSKEIEVLRMASSPPHENIVQLFEVFDKPKRMYLVQELLSGGNLFERVVERSFFPERDAANTTSQICAALHHIHERGIIHRDLKPENVMYVGPELDSRVKLADFGSSVIVGRGGAKDDAGTPGYVAPEILNGEGKGEDPCVDMWALGVILYILLCGFPPFYEEELPALFDSIKNARYDFPRDSPWDFVSDDGLQLVTKILCLDTARRPSASQVMRHHWTVGAIAGKLPNMAAAPSKHKSVGLRVFRKAALGVIAQQRIMRAIGVRTMLATVVALPSYVAPAPAMRTRTVAPVMETKEDLVVLAEKLNPIVKFYDPLALASTNSGTLYNAEAGIGYLRHSEIKHGRIAMAAFVGFIVQSNGIHFPWATTLSGVTYADISAAGGPAAQWDALPTAAKLQIFGLIFALELWGEGSTTLASAGEKHYMRGGKPGFYPPFDLFRDSVHSLPFNLFDPFGFSKNATPEKKAKGLLVEINNGRAAMLGIFGFMAESKIPGSVPALTGKITPYAGEYMAPFSATDNLPFVADMLNYQLPQ